MFADVVIYRGKVITMDSRESIAEALAVKFGKILAVGSNEEIKPLIGVEAYISNRTRFDKVPKVERFEFF